MTTSFASSDLEAGISPSGFRRFRLGRRRAILAVVIAGAGFVFVKPPAAVTPDECGERTGSSHCAFENAPARVGSKTIRLPGQPHPYSELVATLRFTDAAGEVWTAPRRTLTDGASIPPVFVPLIGDPRSREFVAAAALHDAYCGAGNETLPQFRARDWEATHRMFYASLRQSGVSATKAKIMFAAVYLGGPRWNDPKRSLAGVSDERLQEEMERCIRFITENDPDLAEIEAWMRYREAVLLSAADSAQ